MGTSFAKPIRLSASATVAGEAGVRYAIDILSSEIDRHMALLGIADLSEMPRELLAVPDGRLRRN